MPFLGWTLQKDKQLRFHSQFFYTYNAALMELFGWLRYDPPVTLKRDDHNVKLTHFGQVALPVFAPLHDLESFYSSDDHRPGAVEWPTFGSLQSLFQPYFPAWRNNLVLPPQPKGGEGVYVWKLTLPRRKSWWLLAINHDHSLDTLIRVILDALEFDHDHLYEFRYLDAFGRTVRYLDPTFGEGTPANQVTMENLPVPVGGVMEVTYDFGDEWQFIVRLERIDPPKSVKNLPRVLKSHGKPPEQYFFEE